MPALYAGICRYLMTQRQPPAQDTGTCRPAPPRNRGRAGDHPRDAAGVQIRPATTADLDTVTRLRLAFLADLRRDQHPGAALDAEFADATATFLAGASRAGRLHSWLAETAGGADRRHGIVSVLLFPVPPRPDDRRPYDGYIINMYVAPERRHQGIGRALLDACLASAPALGIRRFWLHATEDGRPLYDRAGFSTNPAWMELPAAR